MKKIQVVLPFYGEMKCVNCAQGYHVVCISKEEAMYVRQGYYYHPCYSFKQALENAKLTYDENKLLGQGQFYKGYIAMLVYDSVIAIFYLEGSLYVERSGNVSSYTELSIKGTLQRVADIRHCLNFLVREDDLPEACRDFILENLRQGKTEINVSDNYVEILKKCSDIFQVVK